MTPVRLVFFDRDADVCGFAELGAAANGEAAFGFGVWREGHGECYLRGHVAPGADGPLRVEQGADGAWAIAFAHAGARCELEWRAAGDGARFAGPGQVSGRLELAGEDVGVTGIAEAIEAEASAPDVEQEWSALVVEDVGNGCHVGIASVDGRDRLTGYLRADGRTVPLRWADLSVAYAYAGGPPLRASLRVRDGDGRRGAFELPASAIVSRVEASATRRRTVHTAFSGVPGADVVGHLAHSYERTGVLRPRYVVRSAEEIGA